MNGTVRHLFIRTSLGEYKENLQKIIKLLKKTCTYPGNGGRFFIVRSVLRGDIYMKSSTYASDAVLIYQTTYIN